MKAKWIHAMGIVENGQATFIGIDFAYGPDKAVVFCRCGHHPGAFKSSPSLNAMTTHDIMDLLEKMGHRQCEIRDDGNGRINIITSEGLAKYQQEMIEASVPAGVRVHFTIKVKNSMPLPKGLEKWARDTQKELKKRS